MKKHLITCLSLLFLLLHGCGKTDDCDSIFKLSPMEYELFLELKNGNQHFEDEEVFISNKHEMQNGILAPMPYYNNEVIWNPLYQVDVYSYFDTVVFGYKITTSSGHNYYAGVFVGMGPTSACGYDNRSHWNRNSYYLLKFPDSSIDTLRIQDKKEVFKTPKYTIYLNGVAQDYFLLPKNYITIQK